MLRLARRTFRPDIPNTARCADALRAERHGSFTAATLRGAETGHSPASGNVVVAYERLCHLPDGALLAWRTALSANPDWRAAITAAADVPGDDADVVDLEGAFGRLLCCARRTFRPGESTESVALGLEDISSAGLLAAFEDGRALPGQHIVVALEHGYGLPPGSLGCWRTALWSAVAGVPASAGTTDRPGRGPTPRSRTPQPGDGVAPEPRATPASPSRTRRIARSGRARVAAAAGGAVALLAATLVALSILGGDAAESTDTAVGAPAAADPGAGCVPRAGAGGDDRATLVGRILTPRSGERITSRVFYATGTLKGEIGGRHAWVAARVQAGFVPKDDEIATARWRARIEEPFADRLDLVLLEVDEEGHQQIIDWIRDGLRTGEYPPFDLPGAIVLDETCDVHLTSSKPVT